MIEELRKYRFYDNTAYFDYFGTLIIAFLLTYKTRVPLTLTTIGVYIFSILSHYVFNISTVTSRYLSSSS